VLTDQGKLLQLAAMECSKLAAVRYIADREGVAFADVVAFGDDNNDIPLLQAAGLGVAMLNATAELKAVANMVGMSNEEEGVGKVLEWLLEGGGSQ
jgi:hydroxymethylpyrimidine pyrophosphatase-like HAD family hydrolase